MSQTKPLIRSLPPADLPAVAESLGYDRYRGGQLGRWLYRLDAMSWDGMTNLPAEFRRALDELYAPIALRPVTRQVAADGTRKFLFALRDGETVESVIIPMERYATFCISSQVGCRMACRFCATARGGLVRNLDSGEIVEQVLRLRADLAAEPLTGHGARQFNVVFMGMGEPLDNWQGLKSTLDTLIDPAGVAMSRRRIQISTSGSEEGLQRLVASHYAVGLTISLGGSNDEERRRVMPRPGRTGLQTLRDLAEQYARQTHRRVTLAYVLIAGVSDHLDQARRLVELVRGRPFKVNLIPLNEIDGDSLTTASRERTAAFQNVLVSAGIDTFIRTSGGQDIAAACGQLRRRHSAGKS